MKKTLSLVLVVCTLVSFLSLGIDTIAADVNADYEIETSIMEKGTQLEGELGSGLFEIMEERDRYTKVFSDSQGNKSAVVSATPIHYNDNGKWVDIDNTLIENASGDSYINTDNEFIVSLPTELSDDSCVVFEKNENYLSFNLQGTDLFALGQAIEADKQISEDLVYANGQDIEFLNKTETVEYKAVGDNTDLEYSVIPNGIKENIIISIKPDESVQYTYNITSNNIATLNADKSVSFSDSRGNNIFVIPTPVMYDANGEVSYDIAVTLTGSNGIYTLTYIPSYTWLSNTAVYPVVVDPEVIVAGNENNAIFDASVSSQNPTVNTGSETAMVVGIDSGNEYISFIGTTDLPILNSNVVIKSAALFLYTSLVSIPSGSSGFEVVAYPVVSDFTEDEVTYSNQPTINTSVFLDKYKYTSDSMGEYHAYDITEAYTSNGLTCYGIALKSAYLNVEGLALYGSSEYESAGGSFYQPYIYVEYYETKGVEEQFDYHTKNAGRAGVVYYNDFTNQVHIERNELGLDGRYLPVQINRYFNSGSGGTLSEISQAFSTGVSYYGYGWLTNYNQFIEYASPIDERKCIIYTNPNGKTTYFMETTTKQDGLRKWEEVPDKFSTAEGYELWLPISCETNIPSNLDKVYIKDPTGLIYEFNNNGLLVRIKKSDDPSVMISINYNDNYSIDKIVDGVGREYRFVYTQFPSYSYPVLTEIQTFEASGLPIKTSGNIDYKIEYQYTELNYFGRTVPILSSAVYPDGECVNYTMTEDIIKIMNVDGYSVEFEFSDIGNCEITERSYCADGSVVEGEKLSVSRVNSHEKTFTDSRGVKQTKQFDLFGRTICIINADGTYAPKRYSNDQTSNGYTDYDFYVEHESYSLEGTNLISNGNFNSALSGWNISTSNNVYRATNADCNIGANPMGSLCFKGQADGLHYATKDIEIADGRAGDRYVFDFANKCYKCHYSIADYRLCFITIRVWTEVNGTLKWVDVCDIVPSQFNTNWQKYSYGFTVDSDYSKLQIRIAHYNEYGHAWYDDLVLVNTYKPLGSSDTSDGSEDSGSTETGDRCSCDGCIETACPCRTCSDSCSEPSCNRGYDYGDSPSGTWFTVNDGQIQMTLSQNYSGNYYGTQTDMNGLITQYNYNQSNGQLISEIDGKGNIVSYTYDAMNRLNSVSSIIDGVASDNHISTSYEYEKDRVSSISHNGTTYNYEYDAWGNIASVSQGDNSLISYTYGDGENRNRTNSIVYGNGDYVIYDYNTDGYIETIQTFSSDNILMSSYVYTYDLYGIVTSITNVIENTQTRHSSGSTSFVLLNGEGEADDIILYSIIENESGETTEIFNGETYITNLSNSQTDTYTGKTTTSSVVNTGSLNIDITYTTDYFGRVDTKAFSNFLYEEDGLRYTMVSSAQYSYKDISFSQTTGLVESYRTRLYGNISVVDGVDNVELPEENIVMLNDTEYIYAYDNNGNIVSVSVDNGLQTDLLCSYVYDGADQLVRENNYELGKTIVYTYDGDNIVSKSEYEVTQGALGTPADTVIYGYDESWTDKLTSYDGTEVLSDNIGNPLNYIGTNVMGETVTGTLEWNGRQLAAIESDDISYEFTYNSDGLRTSVREYNSDNQLEKTYYYIWDLGKLVGYYVIGSDGAVDYSVKMLYNEQGDSEGYVFNDTESQESRTLYFQRNMLGDIIGVYDDTYGLLISYGYDAYGNVTTQLHQTGADALLRIVHALLYTPITYRGYMYDPLLGMYYLQSRYYNPLYGRFLNADTTDILTQTLGTLHSGNLFAYCSNNPIMNVDYSGEVGLGTIIFMLVVVVLLVIGVVLSPNDFYNSLLYMTTSDLVFKDDRFKKLQEVCNAITSLDGVINNIQSTYIGVNSMSEEYWKISSLYIAHTKNIVDYGTGVNEDPQYPFLDKIYPNASQTYKKMCENAYIFMTDNWMISRDKTWDSLSLEEKFILVHGMSAYDPTFYRKLTVFSTRKLIWWAMSEMVDLYAELCSIIL